MASNNLDSINERAVSVNGGINEDVLQKIIDISPTDRPFANAIGSATQKNPYKEWALDKLATASADNATVEGANVDGQNDAVAIKERVGNFTQLSDKVARVSTTLDASDMIGHKKSTVRQYIRKMEELKLDEDTTYISGNVAEQGDGIAVPSKTAGIGAWLKTNTDRGAGGADPILSGAAGIGGFPETAAVAGTSRAISETMIKTVMQEIYTNGGNATMLLSSPAAIGIIADYLYSSSFRGATIQTEVSQDAKATGTQGGNSTAKGATNAVSSVDTISTNFGTLTLVPCRRFPVAADVSDVYLLDKETWKRSYLQPYKSTKLATTGHAENTMFSVEYSLCALSEHANGIIADVDTTLPMTT